MGFAHAVGTAGNLGLPGRAPFPPVPTAWRKEPSPRQTDRNTPLPPQENQFNKENNLWNASNPGPCPVLWSSCPPGKPSLSGCWRPSAPPMPSTASPRWTPLSLNRRRSSWPKAAARRRNRSTASPRGTATWPFGLISPSPWPNMWPSTMGTWPSPSAGIRSARSTGGSGPSGAGSGSSTSATST